MPTLSVADTLKFVNLQMAAEALYNFDTTKNTSLTPGETSTGPILKENLTTGNGRASKFTEPQAADFADKWVVVEHKSNTTTGFSGTLFKCIKDDPATGAKPSRPGSRRAGRLTRAG